MDTQKLTQSTFSVYISIWKINEKASLLYIVTYLVEVFFNTSNAKLFAGVCKLHSFMKVVVEFLLEFQTLKMNESAIGLYSS